LSEVVIAFPGSPGLWKLRDGRVAALLLETRVRVTANVSPVGSAFGRGTRWLVGGSRAAHDLRVAVAMVLFVRAGLDEVRYVLSVNSPVSTVSK